MANLTIDIIYYKTASDFEMEFNLTGCCRMRMFKDKVDSQKGLVNTLARDVSRSTITIIVTDLLGENSGISTLSKAIRLPLIPLDKANYGVNSNDEYVIPETAVPLVTSEGLFGGCIIANGPQSIIIVSSSRPLRHEIMKAYVHNYVFDIGQYVAYQNRMGNTAENIPSIPEIQPAVTTPVETKAQEIEDIVSEDKPAAETENILETENDNAPEDTTERFTILDPDDEFIDDNDLFSGKPLVANTPKKSKKRGRASNVLLLIIVLLLLIGFGVLAYYFVFLPLLSEPSAFTDGNGNMITDFLNSLFS